MRVLMVDDDEDAVLLTSFLLEHQGWEVVAAGDGAEARTKAEQGPFDLVLLDYLLPDGDGRDLFQALRKEGLRSPVVFLTGREEPGLEQNLRNLGALGLIAKPFDPERLVPDLRNLLRRLPAESP